MSCQYSTDQPSDRQATYQYSNQTDIGTIFRRYGEIYIKEYSPDLRQIKLMRSMRICKTPALGARVIICTSCGHKHYIYLSCGHSHCPLCQTIKREQWIDKLKAELYDVPYVHMIFTLPHELKGLLRNNESEAYSLLMRTAWSTVKTLSSEDSNMGALPGMINVLHTFGSDMKYHVHCHCLVTFGGLGKDGQWRYPKRKDKIARYRKINSTYKRLFMKGLQKLYERDQIVYHMNFEEIEKMLASKSWVVHNTPPTIDTSILENYLSRYINRVAISKSRVEYLRGSEKVKLLYKDYKHQQTGQAAPTAYKLLDPLIFIDQFMQHVLPPYFQKTRRYGLHASATKKKHKQHLDETVKRNGQTVRTAMQIITQLIKETCYECQLCQSKEYRIETVSADRDWLDQHVLVKQISPPKIRPRSPPNKTKVNTYW